MSNTNTDILLAGAVAAFTVDLLVYPLDTLKTRLQSPDYKRIYTNASTNSANKALLFRGLYQGVGSVIVATLPSSGAFFTTYEGIKHILMEHNPTLSDNTSPVIPQPIIHATASSIAELVSCFILTPAEVLKQNAQMIQQPSSSSSPSYSYNISKTTLAVTHPVQTTRQIPTLIALRKFNHPSQLWRGYTALAARNLPFTAMQFPMFEHLKKSIQAYRKRKGKATGTLFETGMITAISAGSAGSVAAVLTTPIDVVKTRIMLSASSDGEGYQGESKSKAEIQESKKQGKDAKAEVESAKRGTGGRLSSWAIGREVVKKEGIRGLWRGGALRGAWTALGSGLYLGVYESGRTWLGERRDGRRKDGDRVA